MAEKDFEATGRTAGPVRVLHVTDTLGGGGTERLIMDIVRLSDPERVRHRVVTFFPDGHFGPFVYAEPLRALDAYGGRAGRNARPTHTPDAAPALDDASAEEASQDGARPTREESRSFARGAVRRLPSPLKRPLYGMLGAAASFRERRLGPATLHAGAALRLAAECRRFRPDVINVHGFHPFSYGLLLKRLLRRPLVHMVPSAFSQMRDQGTGWLPRLYERHHGRVDLFLLAAGYEPELMGVGVPKEKLLAFGGPVDVEAIERLRAETERHRAEVRRRLGLPDDALVALSVGRFHTSKGHQYALEALPPLVSEFPNLHWVVLGDGPERGALEQRAAQLGAVRSVHFVGFEPSPLPFYAAADVYLRTPLYEGDNLSSCQALAMGLPVVGFDTGSASDIIKREGFGTLVPNRDAPALAASVARVLASPDRGRALAGSAVDYCRAHLDVRRVVESFVAAYLRLHRGGGGRGALVLQESPGPRSAASKH
jgi:glycosyltransferase involved in cell wall biosynthesis